MSIVDAGNEGYLMEHLEKVEAERDKLREAVKPLAELSPYGCPFCEEHSLPTGAEHNCAEVPTAIAALAGKEDV